MELVIFLEGVTITVSSFYFFLVCIHLFNFSSHSCKKVSKTWMRIVCEDTTAFRRCQRAEEALRVRKRANTHIQNVKRTVEEFYVLLPVVGFLSNFTCCHQEQITRVEHCYS